MELASLVLASALVWLSAATQHLNTVRYNGLAFVMGDRAHPLSDEGFAGRSARALRNNLESALMFVPVMVAILLTGHQSATTSLLALIYMIARVTFTLAYWFSINKLRSVSWALGMASIFALHVLTLINWMNT